METTSSLGPQMARKDFHHPYQPYDIQQHFMEAVYDCIENKKVGIFESPTGTGKSLSLICGSLTWLREHKRRNFEEGLQSLQSEDEPEWVLEHAKEARRRDALQLRTDFEARLVTVRAKEQKVRERHINREPLHKRRKHADDDDSAIAGEEDYMLDDYDDDPKKNGSESGPGVYSADTVELFEKLGMVIPASKSDHAEDPHEELKVFFCSRTHSQLSQFVNELRRVKLPPSLPMEPNKQLTADFVPLNEQLKQISLGSRKNLCINPKVAKLNSQTAIHERCLELQQPKTLTNHRCPFLPGKDSADVLLDFRDHALAKVRDIEDLASVGKRLGICPYYASRPAIGPAEMVTLPYPLLLQKSAREALGISLKGQIVIIDEAHNLMSAVESLSSTQVTDTQLKRARESLMIYLQKFRNRLKGSNRVYVTQVVRVLDSLLLGVSNLASGEGLGGTLEPASLLSGKAVDQINLSKLIRYITESKLARKVEGYVAYQETSQLGQTPSAKADNPIHGTDVPTLTHLQGFLYTLLNPSREGRFFWANDGGQITLRYLLLDPSEHFREIAEDARAVILAGGTMSPVEDYRQQLFPYLQSVQTISCGHIIPPSSLFVRVLSADPQGPLDFSFKTRGSKSMVKRLGGVLLQILPEVKGGTVVFFPSYIYLDAVLQQWHLETTITKMCKIKQTFFDSRTTPGDKLFSMYSDTINADPRGAVLFSVIGGSLSEGINFSDDLGRCVIVVGLPYPNLETPEWKAKMQYIDDKAVAREERKGIASREHAENVCMRAVNQAIGRAIRHKDDWSSILLLDSRYMQARVRGKLPGWIKSSMHTEVEAGGGRAEVVASDLGKFFALKK